MSGPLHGITVIDLTRVLAGPWCTQILGDLGADVIKIEKPGSGDDTRKFAPPFLRDPNSGKETSESAYFAGANRNKRSLALDIAKPAGQAVLRKLIARADVLVENFKTGTLARYGLGYDDLKSAHPKLVYCSITGFGQTGPYAQRPGYDFLIQGAGGLMSLTGEPDGEPQKVGVPVSDLTAGMYASVAICAALRHCEAGGQGQYIDVGMLDTTVAYLSNQGMNYLASGERPARLGNAHPNIVPYQVFKTADGHVIVAVGNDEQFKKFCGFAGVPELPNDPLFRSNDLRVRNRAAVLERLAPVMAAKPSKHWLDGLDKLGIGVGPINTLDQVFADPHVQARGMVADMPHKAAGGGKVKLLASPFKLSGTPVSYRRAPPMLGEHTEDLLAEFGLGADEIARLKAERVI
jgi:crotonobetainyl-CoA:carnitine CoA-transferase CaiB-like acyl-CoA transferase